MARIGQQIEHQRGDSAIVDDPMKFVAVDGAPIKIVETDPAAEKAELDISTSTWPYNNGKR